MLDFFSNMLILGFQPNNNIQRKTFNGNIKKQVPQLSQYVLVDSLIRHVVEDKKVSRFDKLKKILHLPRKEEPKLPISPGRLTISKDEHLVIKTTLLDMFENMTSMARNNRYKSNKDETKLSPHFLSRLYNHGYITDEDLPKLFTSGAGIIDTSDFKYFISLRKNLTSYDNKNVINSRIKTYISPMPISEEALKQKTQEIITKENKVIENLPQNAQLILIHGAPGSGKSSLMRKISNISDVQFYNNEADNIKKRVL